MGKYKKKIDDKAGSKSFATSSLKRKIASRAASSSDRANSNKASKVSTVQLKINNNEKLKRLTNRKKRKQKNAIVSKQSDSVPEEDQTATAVKNKKPGKDSSSLRERMMNRLQGARFR